MIRQFLSSKILLGLIAVGLFGLVLWRITIPQENPNLLTNSDFERGGLSGWQVQNVGDAQATVKSSNGKSDSGIIVLSIPDSAAGSWVGFGQHIPIEKLQRYRVLLNYRLVLPAQSAAKYIVRVTQYDADGEPVKKNEYSSTTPLVSSQADDGNPAGWQSSQYVFVTHWRAATAEVGVGLLGTQATAVEVNNLVAQVNPNWLSTLWHDSLALSVSLLAVILIGYLVGWPVGQQLYRYVERRQTKRLSIWRELGWVTLLYTGLTLLLTYPVGWQLETAVAGVTNWDSWMHVWYQWWIKEASLDLGVWPHQVTLLYFPLNIDHPFLASRPYVALVSLPFTLLFDSHVSYNIAILMGFIFSGLTGYLLCRHLCRQANAAIIGGLIFAFYPNRTGHAIAGHLEIVTNYFLPLYALSLLVLLRRPSAKRAVWYAIVTVLFALAQPINIAYGIIPTLLVIGGHELWVQYRSPHKRNLLKRSIRRLITANLLAMGLFLPFAWPLISQSQRYLDAGGMDSHAINLLAFILPSPYNPILAKLGLTPSGSLFGIGRPRDLGEPLAYLGVIVTALSLLAIWKRWRASRPWLGLALACAIFSMGSDLRVGTQIQEIAMPYNWLADLPFVGWSRTPARLIETVMLGIGVLAALGIDWFLETTFQTRLKAQRTIWRGLVTILLIGLITIEYQVIFPFPTESLPNLDYYHQLANESIQGGVLELPTRTITNYAMFAQTIHEKQLAGGYINRSPAGTAELSRFFHQFLWPWSQQTVFASPEEDQVGAILADMKIERIIAHKEQMRGNSGKATLRQLSVLFGSPIFEDEQTLVYSVPLASKPTLPAWQLMPDQKNWTVVDDGSTLRMEKNGNLYIYAAQPGPAKLEFDMADSSAAVSIDLTLNDVPLEPVDHNDGRQAFRLPLNRGFNYLRLNTRPTQEIEIKQITIEDAGL